jgi:hypothetical protein
MITIHLDRPRNVRVTVGMLNRFKAAINAGGKEFEAIAAIVHESLKKDDPDLTSEALEDMLDAETLGTIWAAVNKEIEALGSALNPPKASEAPATTGSEN